MKDLLRTSDLTHLDIDLILDLAADFRGDPHRRPRTLNDQTVVMYFTQPSTRTRLSLESAVVLLGGTPIAVGPADLHLGGGETIGDTARVISRYAAAIAVRTAADEDVRRMAAAATVPVINALTDLHHPCQSLADLLTLRDRFGRLGGLRVAFLGDGTNVAHSLMEACAVVGVDIAVATPAGHEVDPGVLAGARVTAQRTGSRVTTTQDPGEALQGAHAVYADAWISTGDHGSDRMTRLADFDGFQVDEDAMRTADPGAIFMHCLPAYRGEEVTSEVIDGPRSVVFDQAENRLWTETALLYALCRGLLASRSEEEAAAATP